MKRKTKYAKITLEYGHLLESVEWTQQMPFRKNIEDAVADMLDRMDKQLKAEAKCKN